MKLAAVILLLCSSGWAQQSVWVDLTGAWKQFDGDDPGFARPDFNDSAWNTVRVPFVRPAPPGRRTILTYWLRKTIDPPREATAVPLALTLGTINGSYQVFINGKRVEPEVPFDIQRIEIPRPRTFALDSGAANRLALAIRVQETRLPSAWMPIEPGPWVLTDRESAPRREGLHVLAWQRLFRLGDFAEPLVLMCLVGFVFVIWFNRRDQREILWLALYMIAVAAGRCILFFLIGPDPLPIGIRPVIFVLGVGVTPFLAQFVADWTGAKWLGWTAWGLVVLCLFLPSQIEQTGGWLIDLLTVAGLARHIFWNGRDRLLVPLILLVIYAHASSWLRIDSGLGLPRLVQYNLPGWISFAFVWHTISTTLLGLVFTFIQVRRLLRERDERIRLSSELEAARTVQQFLVRSSVEGVEAIYLPASEVGGDFYQVLPLDDGATLVALGDVSGKGLKAAMVVSMLVALLRCLRHLSPGCLLAEMNRVLLGTLDGGFVTCVVARLETDGRAVCACAGHPSPFADGGEVALNSGLPLGVAEAGYEETIVRFASLTIFSDGVIEAMNPKSELFGFERTREISGRSAHEIAEAARAWGQNDDITVVTVRRKA